MLEATPAVPARSWRDIDRIALEVRKRLGLSPSGGITTEQIIEIFDFGKLELLGIRDYGVEDLPFGNEGKYSPEISSLILSKCTYDGLHNSEKRANFTLFHEIGHAVLHGKYLKNACSARTQVKQFNRKTIPAYMDPECQANQFAAAILMPYDSIKTDIIESCSIEKIAQKYNVSTSAASNRINYVKK